LEAKHIHELNGCHSSLPSRQH